MIKKTICIKDYQDFSLTDERWGSLFGLTDDGNIIYYTGQTNSNANIAKISILLTSTIDDIGYYETGCEDWDINTQYNSGNTVFYSGHTYLCTTTHLSGLYFNDAYWSITPINIPSEYTLTYTGSTRINEFRRYGKTDSDPDLYNPTWNTGFTKITQTSTGSVNQITGERERTDGLSKQNLYDYKIWSVNNTGSTISYSDINSTDSIISYNTSGLTNQNSIQSPLIKYDYLIGVVSEPKINIDVFIDRGDNSSYDRHMRLGDVKSLTDLENYGNGYFKIKEI
jgi:hypothetical protein